MLLRERPNLTNNTEAQSTTVGVSASVYEKLSPIFREHLEAIKNKYGDSANNLTTKQEALLHVINTTDNPREAQSVIYKLMFVDQSNGEDSKQEAAQAEVFQNLSTQEISYTLINLIKSKIEKKEISITQISELNSLNKYCDLINTLQESNLLTPPKLFKRILINQLTKLEGLKPKLRTEIVNIIAGISETKKNTSEKKVDTMIPENIDTIKIKPKSENLKQSFWSKSINAMRNKYLQVAIGVGTTATLAYSNFNKAPEMTTNPTIITPPKVENVETKVKTQVKKPEITITNESVSKGKLMKITEITTKGLKGEVNEDKFNPKSLVDILKTFNLDSDQTFQRLLERYGAQELINKGVIKLTRTKGPGENKIQFEIKLTNTSLEFTQQKTPEIKTAQTIQYDNINKKIVV